MMKGDNAGKGGVIYGGMKEEVRQLADQCTDPASATFKKSFSSLHYSHGTRNCTVHGIRKMSKLKQVHPDLSGHFLFLKKK